MRPSESHKSWLTGLAQQYHEALTDEVRSWLADRALGPDVVRGALLGLVADPDPAHEQYRGRLAIPFLTPTGVVSMRFRCLQTFDSLPEDAEILGGVVRTKFPERVVLHECEGHGKYEGVAGDTTHLYNVQALHDATTEIGVTEGELDALAATYAGLPSVGCPGASAWKPFYYRLFDDFERVYVLGDGDTAGRKWASGLATNIPGAISRVQPPGHDVTSYLVEFGAEKFLQTVRRGCNPDTTPVP